ncbi:hypothetical protein FI667_g14905, partial [Globisporangium splendens]
MGIVFGMVHFESKIRERARQTVLMREQEAIDDYDEIMTPLAGRSLGPTSMEVFLHEGETIFRKPKDEVLYEGDMHWGTAHRRQSPETLFFIFLIIFALSEQRG